MIPLKLRKLSLQLITKHATENTNDQAPRDDGSYNFGARVAASPKPNIHMTFGSDDKKGKPKKGKKQYEPKKRE